MIQGRPSSASARMPRPRTSFWTLAHGLLLTLILLHKCLSRMGPGKARNCLLNFVRHHTNRMEHIFRCLLILMKPTPRIPKPAPFIPRAPSTSERLPQARRTARSFSLSLSQLRKGFETYSAGQPLAGHFFNRPRHTDRHPPRGPTACAPVADPVDLLTARLKAMRALFSDPDAHAARLAALLKTAGLGRRAARPRRPAAEAWDVIHHFALIGPLARAAVCSDTS